MRIACIYLPSFPLQAHVRQAPHLASSPLAVADGAVKGSVLVAVSRAAWAEGVRPGMPVTTARIISSELEVVTPDPALCRRALDALIESLMPCTDVIDLGPSAEAVMPHRAIYLKVPARARASAFGQKVLSALSRQGFRGRVGIADDRFTAYVAAVRVEQQGRAARLDDLKRQPPLFHQSCTVVPRGGSAAFLAPLPLSWLPIDSDVQHLLETCGVKTLGDFAALPPPSMGRDRIAEDSDFQALARGNGPTSLRATKHTDVCERRVSERMALIQDSTEHAPGDEQPLAFAVRTLCERIGQRLEGRKRAAAALELVLEGTAGERTTVAVQPDRPTAATLELVDAVCQAIAAAGLRHAVVALELAVTSEIEPHRVPAQLSASSVLVDGHRQPSLWPVGMATRQAEAFRQAEARSVPAQAGSHGRPPRRDRRRAGIEAGQQMLSFFE